MTKTKQKILGIALSASMIASCFTGMSIPASAEGESTYSITIPSTLTVENSGWNSIGNISATGSLESGKKLTVTAASTNDWKLVSGTNDVSYTMKSASTDTEATTSWEFTELSSTATTKPIGIDVEDYSEKPAGTYTDTVTFTAKVETVASGNPAPTTASISDYMAGTFGWSDSGSAATNLPTINTFAANDSISLLSANNANTKFTTTAGGASATFSGTAADDSKFYAVYPYTAGLTLSGDVISGIVIPTSQWNSGWNSTSNYSGWDPKAPIAYATTTGSSLTFHNACAILKVTFPKANTFGCFTISANESLAGTFSLDTSTGTLTPTSGSTTVTVGNPSDIESGICTDMNGKTVYVAIAPGTYTNFNLHIYNEDNEEKSQTKSGSVTFEAGKIYDLGSYDLGIL